MLNRSKYKITEKKKLVKSNAKVGTWKCSTKILTDAC